MIAAISSGAVKTTWKCGTSRTSDYPLANVVAEALFKYLRSGRPQPRDRHVPFRVLAPKLPITNGAVSAIVAAYLRKAGPHVRRPGAHTPRHICAEKLIEAEFPSRPSATTLVIVLHC